MDVGARVVFTTTFSVGIDVGDVVNVPVGAIVTVGICVGENVGVLVGGGVMGRPSVTAKAKFPASVAERPCTTIV